MIIDKVCYCNVCLSNSKDDGDLVFISGLKNGEVVHICTSCIPTTIHGGGLGVKLEDEIKQEIG